MDLGRVTSKVFSQMTKSVKKRCCQGHIIGPLGVDLMSNPAYRSQTPVTPPYSERLTTPAKRLKGWDWTPFLSHPAIRISHHLTFTISVTWALTCIITSDVPVQPISLWTFTGPPYRRAGSLWGSATASRRSHIKVCTLHQLMPTNLATVKATFVSILSRMMRTSEKKTFAL